MISVNVGPSLANIFPVAVLWPSLGLMNTQSEAQLSYIGKWMHSSLQSSLRFYQVLNQRRHAIHDEGCSKEETSVANSVTVSISDRTSKLQVQRKAMFVCCTSLPALWSSGNEPPAAYRSHTQRSPGTDTPGWQWAGGIRQLHAEVPWHASPGSLQPQLFISLMPLVLVKRLNHCTDPGPLTGTPAFKEACP